MNIDEAMEIADSSNLRAEFYYGSLCEAVGVLRKEVERLRAELAETKAENVGLEEGHDRLEAELELSESNVESLKKALFDLQNAAIRLGDQVDDAKAELAAAKAASACPVEIAALGDADWECSVCVRCESDDDANKLFDWLWERVEERGEQ